MPVKVTFAGSGDAFGSGGRFNTCILVDGPGRRIAIDFGASSLIALNKLAIPHNSIDVIILTHIHGDHSAGIPFLLVDAMLGAKRTTPLTIAGPRDTRARLNECMDALFPGSNVMQPKFELNIVEMNVMTANDVAGVTVTPFPAAHTGATNPTSVRVEIGGKIISYTGDSDWTKHMPALAQDADLLISECYFHEKKVPAHMNYPTFKAHEKELQAKRIVLTHLGPEMLAHIDDVPEECSYDGMVIEV